MLFFGASATAHAETRSEQSVLGHCLQRSLDARRGVLLRAFYLDHRIRKEDAGLNPEYICIFAREEYGGQLVLRPEMVTGESRATDNDQAKGRDETTPPGPELALLETQPTATNRPETVNCTVCTLSAF